MRNPKKSSTRLDRNIMERSRRMQMKVLLSTLSSSMQIKPISKGKLALLALLEQATSYIKELKVKVEEVKEIKEQQLLLLKESELGMDHNYRNIITTTKAKAVVEVKEMGGSTMEVNLITGLENTSIILHQILILLHEEGAEAVSVSYSSVAQNIFYTIHFQPLWSRLGVEVSRVQHRLMELLFS